jgi:hypothetical protein
MASFQLLLLGHPIDRKKYKVFPLKLAACTILYIFFVLGTRKIVEFLFNFNASNLGFVISAEDVILSLISSFLSISSFLHIFIYNLVGFQMRFEAIASAISRANSSSEIKKISTQNLQLFSSLVKFNKIFPMPLECFLTWTIISTSFSLYEIYFAIWRDGIDRQQLGICVLTNIWNLMIAQTILLILKFCVNLKNSSALIFNSLIRSLMEKNEKKIRKSIEIFLLQMEHVKIQVGTGFHGIDWKLMLHVSNFHFSINNLMINSITFQYLATIMSFLIILIQFSQLYELEK